MALHNSKKNTEMSLDFDDINNSVGSLYEDYTLAKRDVDKETSYLEKCAKRVEEADDANAIVQAVATIVQEKAHKQISQVVTKCLQTVFEEEAYEFSIIFEQKRGKTEARLVFLRNGNELDPITSSGGGAVDVAAFALRISCLLVSRPALRRTIILDEPFKFLSAKYRGRVANMLTTLSEELNVQFIMVTHIKELEVGNVIAL